MTLDASQEDRLVENEGHAIPGFCDFGKVNLPNQKVKVIAGKALGTIPNIGGVLYLYTDLPQVR